MFYMLTNNRNLFGPYTSRSEAMAEARAFNVIPIKIKKDKRLMKFDRAFSKCLKEWTKLADHETFTKS